LHAGLVALSVLGACTSNLELTLDGKQCQGEEQLCLAGYVCDSQSNLCVLPEQLGNAGGAAGSGEGGRGSSSGGGTGGNALYGSALDGGPASAPPDAAASPGPDGGAEHDAGGALEHDAAAGDAGTFCSPSTLYPDHDGDGVGLTSGASVRCPAPGWVSQPGDCRDDQERVYLGQQDSSAVPFPDPTKSQQLSFDFDCSGSEEPDPDNSPSGAPPDCAQLVTCVGSGYLPAVPARAGAGIEPRCGSNLLRRCVSGALPLTCMAEDLALADELRFRCH
jgi:hypothetical protein